MRAGIRIKIPLQVEAIHLPADAILLARFHLPRPAQHATPHMPVTQPRLQQRRDPRPPRDFEDVIPRPARRNQTEKFVASEH